MKSNVSKKKEIFAQEVAKGSTYSDAYRVAYPNSKKWKPQSITNKASALARDSEVQLLIQNITAKVQEQDLGNTICSAQECREILSDIIRNAECRIDDRVRAIKQLSDMSGYNAPTISETRIKIRAESISDEDLRRIAYGD